MIFSCSDRVASRSVGTQTHGHTMDWLPYALYGVLVVAVILLGITAWTLIRDKRN